MLNQAGYKNKFENWYSRFRDTKLFTDMSEIKESFRWHQEKDIAVHTDMVVKEYITNTPEYWTKKDFLGALHCAFHDTGKPIAERITTNDDGTIRKKYTGHELYSARIFVDYIYSDIELLRVLEDWDIYNIAVMIQSHIPYGLKKKELRKLKTHFEAFGLVEHYVRCLLADTYGRISNEEANDRTKACQWAEEFFNGIEAPLERTSERVPAITLMCAPVGSGQKRLTTMLAASYRSLGKTTVRHSTFQCRRELYDTDPETSFEMSLDDKNFAASLMREFNRKLTTNDIIIIADSNVSPKKRKKYIKKNTHAVVLLLDYTTTHMRWREYMNKTVGSRFSAGAQSIWNIHEDALHKEYWNFKLPILGEVDKIFIISKMGVVGQVCSMK